MFAIRNKKTGKLLGFYAEAVNDSVEFKFCDSWDNVWVTTSFNHAQIALKSHPEWYNADFDTPINKYNSDDLEIIELKL